MRTIDTLTVLHTDREVGKLRLDPRTGCCVFKYSQSWLADGFSISPLKLQLTAETFIAPREPFGGNFGVFEDSLPDGYGRYLLNRLLKREGIAESSLSPLQRLSIVGGSGMGALRYVPESYVGEDKDMPSLDTLQRMALDVLSEKSAEDADVLYFNSGNSGGCRPKCLLKDEEGDWLVKFRHTYDSQEIGADEFECNRKARECGITVPDFKLIEGRYFASKRFDLDENRRPIHTVTAAGLLDASIQYPSLDYTTLLSLTGYLTQDSKQVEQMFRRMVFNVLIENKDDHAKNFSFLCRNGKWELAPAYDLTRVPAGYNGQHATTVNNNGNPTEEDFLAAAESIRISRQRAVSIINEIKTALKS